MNRRQQNPMIEEPQHNENDLHAQYKRFLLEKIRKEEGSLGFIL